MRNSIASSEERHRRTRATNRRSAYAGAVAAHLYRADLHIVRLCAKAARTRFCRASAIAGSWLGNGPIYPILALGLFLVLGLQSIAVVVVAAISIGLLHCLYPLVKRRTARLRPYRADPALTPLLNALDEHSFPSGHAMTLTAALVPLVLAIPLALFGAVVLWGFFAWARIACAHHYPSDILAGTALGLVVSHPLSVYGFDALAHII